MKKLMSILTVFMVVVILGSCKKENNDQTLPTYKFPLTDLKLTVIGSEIRDDYVRFTYEVKNTSSKDYKYYDSDPRIGVRFSIVATDGTVYQDKSMLTDDILAGKTNALIKHVSYTKGKTITMSKNKFELMYDE